MKKLTLINAGRKYRLMLISLLTIVVCFSITAFVPATGPGLGVTVGAIVTLFAAYCGGNVGAAIAAKKRRISQMAMTTNEATSVEARFRAIETKLNEVQTALNALVTKVQMKALVNVRQQEIYNLQNRVATLESQVAALLE